MTTGWAVTLLEQTASSGACSASAGLTWLQLDLLGRTGPKPACRGDGAARGHLGAGFLTPGAALTCYTCLVQDHHVRRALSRREDEMTQRQPPAGVDPTTPNPARMYDYYLGGHDNFAADREAAEKVLAALPEGRDVFRANRAFLGRAVTFLAQTGIRQFIDIGTGLPTQDNVHQVAHRTAPDARVVYVDNDPMVLAHARALLSGPEPVTLIQADLREPDTILNHAELANLIDFNEPVAVLLVAVLHFLTDEENPAATVARFREAMAPGSYLVISHGEATPEVRQAEKTYQSASAPGVGRSHEQIQSFFNGFDLVPPGLVYVSQWRPHNHEDHPNRVVLGGVGRKPASTTQT